MSLLVSDTFHVFCENKGKGTVLLRFLAHVPISEHVPLLE